MFSRFCHFYSVSDRHVLDMPAKRFWAMEGQINRIQATSDLRAIGSDVSNFTREGREKTIERLTLEIGDAYRVKREKFVDPEPGAKQKMASVM